MIWQILRRRDLEYCILHGFRAFTEGVHSDLDIAITQDGLHDLERLLTNLEGISVVQLIKHEASGYYFVCCSESERGFRFSALDAATDYRAKGFVWISREEILNDRRRWNGLWVASRQIEFKYLLTKKVLKGQFTDSSRARLRELVPELKQEAQIIAINLFGADHGRWLIDHIRNDQWETIATKLQLLKASLYFNRFVQVPYDPIRYCKGELGRVWNRVSNPTGLTVAILGPDGSGKSTLIGQLKGRLEAAFRNVESFHLMPGVIRRSSGAGKVIDPHSRPPRSGLVSLIKLVFYWLDYLVGSLLKVYPGVIRSTLVLFDRYFDDLLVDPLRYRYGGPEWWVRLMRSLVPRPQLFLILDVPEGDLLDRKPEVSVTEAQRQVQEYRELANSEGAAHILDGRQSIDSLGEEASRIILEFLTERYLQRRPNLGFHD